MYLGLIYSYYPELYPEVNGKHTTHIQELVHYSEIYLGMLLQLLRNFSRNVVESTEEY